MAELLLVLEKNPKDVSNLLRKTMQKRHIDRVFSVSKCYAKEVDITHLGEYSFQSPLGSTFYSLSRQICEEYWGRYHSKHWPFLPKSLAQLLKDVFLLEYTRLLTKAYLPAITILFQEHVSAHDRIHALPYKLINSSMLSLIREKLELNRAVEIVRPE